MLAAAFPLMQLIGGPLLGSLSDRYGRKPILLFSQFGTLTGFLLLGFANSLIMLFIARVIDGLSGGNIVAAQAAITDSTTEKTRAQGLGLIGAAFGLGFTIGPAIAGIALVLTDNNYHVPAFIAACFSIISIILTFTWLEETLPADKRGTQNQKRGLQYLTKLKQAMSYPFVGTLLVLMFMQQLVFYGFENLMPIFTLDRLGLNAAGNTVLFVFIGIILIMVQGKYIGPWSRRFGERKLIIGGLGMLAFGMIITSVTPPQAVPWYDRDAILEELSQQSHRQATPVDLQLNIPDGNERGAFGIAWILIALVPTTVGASLLMPSINSLITQQVKREETGSILGISSALVSLANAIAPMLGGTLFLVAGSTIPFMLGGFILAGLCVFALNNLRTKTTQVTTG
ncbi:MAG: hypothetical protein CUN56_07955 [Phototrophicales bacterium]|nr:MAG: hypothetical protein CUN56_07955 [Phototrophicales bacterium]